MVVDLVTANFAGKDRIQTSLNIFLFSEIAHMKTLLTTYFFVSNLLLTACLSVQKRSGSIAHEDPQTKATVLDKDPCLAFNLFSVEKAVDKLNNFKNTLNMIEKNPYFDLKVIDDLGLKHSAQIGCLTICPNNYNKIFKYLLFIPNLNYAALIWIFISK